MSAVDSARTISVISHSHMTLRSHLLPRNVRLQILYSVRFVRRMSGDVWICTFLDERVIKRRRITRETFNQSCCSRTLHPLLYILLKFLLQIEANIIPQLVLSAMFPRLHLLFSLHSIHSLFSHLILFHFFSSTSSSPSTTNPSLSLRNFLPVVIL